MMTKQDQEDHEREVEAVLKGLEDSRAGRVRPLAEWDAEFRAKYNIPAWRGASIGRETLQSARTRGRGGSHQCSAWTPSSRAG